MEITAGDVLVQVQRLLGEPAGAYYDLRFRLQQLNMAQQEMVEDAVASSATVEIPLEGDDVYLPEDYLTLGKETPYYQARQGGNTPLRVVDPSFMTRHARGWQSPHEGEPRFIVWDGSRRLRMFPNPSAGTLVVTYVNSPSWMWTEDDQIFGGDPTLARYGTGLAYKVAASEAMGVNPELAQNYLAMFNRELRRMRESRRTSPAREQRARGSFAYGRRLR